jgi:hypothetical protein
MIVIYFTVSGKEICHLTSPATIEAKNIVVPNDTFRRIADPINVQIH